MVSKHDKAAGSMQPSNSTYLVNQMEREIPYILFYDNGSGAVPSHWHTAMEIVYSLEGTTQIIVNGRMHEVREGEIAVAVSGDVHYYTCTPGHRRIVILMDLDIAEDSISAGQRKGEIKKRLSGLRRVSAQWPPEVEQKARNIITELEELNTSLQFGRVLAIKAKALELLLLLCNEAPKDEAFSQAKEAAQSAKLAEQVERVIAYVEQNYMNALTLQEAAAWIGFTPGYFARFFKRFFNTTFVAYLNTYRVNKSQWLLVNSDKSISEISEECGFGSIKTFNRLFKAITGTSPSSYRKSIYFSAES